ncbi:ATP-grasp domain-containing protein [Treponema parvum]|uniref:ATP-grasp domain-containing protein n=1 Tax=Treponema parvum TaxID=138851 RepID=A0A975F575_9SPIR|nr:ATP-grasp domain-containing protein [Treponema parvum]QTQ14691.1 ATP-grasp domain-containing protein [Treponema parvum]
MNIVFYSSNSNRFDGSSVSFKTKPSCKSEWDDLAKKYPEHNFFIVTQMPGMFLLDIEKNEIREKSPSVRYVISEKTEVKDIAREILDLKPDIAMAVTFWTAPYDWLSIKDSMIAEELSAHGVKTVCSPAKSAFQCFDKNMTHVLLENSGFKMPRAVYVHHGLFRCEAGCKEVRENVYREYILSQIEKLNFPVIIKDTVGLSSYKAEVIPTYKSAKSYLFSRKNSFDRIVEEYVSGIQFGAEIYGSGEQYTVMPPFMFSVNSFGITSPKQSVKVGPVTNKKYKIGKLKKMLKSLAKTVRLEGIMQVDLVFSDGQWYILEINSRLSGISRSYAAAQNKSLYLVLMEILSAAKAKRPVRPGKTKYVCNFKMPVLTESQIEKLYEIPFVRRIDQIHDAAASQRRAQGFCEIIFGGTSSAGELQNQLDFIAAEFPQLIEPVFFKNAKELIERL